MPGIAGGILGLLLAAASCSHESSPQETDPAQAEKAQALLGTNKGHLIALATLLEASDTKHYYVDVLREPDGELKLALHMATALGLQPAGTVEGSGLTLLVAEQGKEGWSSKTVELIRQPSAQPEQVVFQGRLPEVFRVLDLTAVIPRLRISGQRVTVRFTMQVVADGKE